MFMYISTITQKHKSCWNTFRDMRILVIAPFCITKSRFNISLNRNENNQLFKLVCDNYELFVKSNTIIQAIFSSNSSIILIFY